MLFSFAALYSLEVKRMETVMKERNECILSGMGNRLFEEDVSFYTCVLSVGRR